MEPTDGSSVRFSERSRVLQHQGRFSSSADSAEGSRGHGTASNHPESSDDDALHPAPQRSNDADHRSAINRGHVRTNSDQSADEEREDENDDASIKSDESFTMRDRQNAINTAHPFGIRLWKPALYKKRRSMEQNAEDDIHSEPNRFVPTSVQIGNLIWSLTFGLVSFVTFAIVWMPIRLLAPFSEYAQRYATLLKDMAWFFLRPFGKYIIVMYSENYRDEDDGHGRPLADYLAWQQSTDGGEQPSRLFFAPRRRRPSQYSTSGDRPRLERESFKQLRLFGRGRWTVSRVLYYIGYYLLLVPVGVLIGTMCWLGVFGVPMARVIYHMLHHLRIHPLALRVRTVAKPHMNAQLLNSLAGGTENEQRSRSSSTHSVNDVAHDVVASSEPAEEYGVVLCTYRAFGMKYYKYTVDGSNVMLLNMMFVVLVTIVDSAFFGFLSQGTHFVLSLISIVPLAHFIGHAVASISAQSSMSMGATINAFFSTIVEVYLYLVALKQGKGELVEGSITGSVLAGVLLMPGLSMCAGAFYRKIQRFNPKSASATSTMLLYTVVGVIAPTIFYALYGPTETHCEAIPNTSDKKCWSSTITLRADDPEYLNIIKPFGGFCAIVLFITYAMGLMFTLRTHAAMIWNANAEELNNEENPEDGPNWGRKKSYLILLSATFLYAMIAEILVDSVDVVLEHVNISQRMLGLTIFALVPNTTEFLNAISFALYGNVALSLEIGSAYALQVCLLQIPALVLLSQRHITSHINESLREYVFVLLFPKWDTWAWIISMMLFAHVHSEGRSNYFKGAILILSYLVILAGFYFNDVIVDIMPVRGEPWSITTMGP